MAQLVTKLIDGYHDLMDNKSDPRVNDWFLMSSPFPTLAICLSYAYFVKRLGPRLMEKRKPYELKHFLIIYNVVQIIINVWLFYEGLTLGWGTNYSYRCQPVDYSYSPIALRIARNCWWYYCSKFTDFLDTIFYVLRKKNHHISTYHVVHHGVMPMSVWFGIKFAPGGQGTFFGFISSFVHIILYSYYLLAALGPRFRKYLWWKNYVTVIQMVMFLLVFIHAFQLIFIECDYPKAFIWGTAMHAVMFLLLAIYEKQTNKKKVREALTIKAKKNKAAMENSNDVVNSNPKTKSMLRTETLSTKKRRK